ncbi:hypothetical protein R1flu_004983 [Riccia fluitans]|uniref:Uncharacterized protein n=1 Tax=Riccia fluitans TaxID=41844 RepID=A0ABD1YUP4_9MARC
MPLWSHWRTIIRASPVEAKHLLATTSKGKIFSSTRNALPVEAKSGIHGDALAATSPPLAKRSPVEVKADYSWRSPSQGFASTGERFANGGEG